MGDSVVDSSSEQRQTAVSGDVVHGHKVGGDMVDGDKYTVDLKETEAVAIGPGARAEINHYTEIIIKPNSLADLNNLPSTPGEPPYKGLAYFTEKDADIYYGRESLSQHISTRLSQQHFLALIGASGSGKSSLLRAGIIPRLRDQNWLIHVITPGKHPLNALTNSLARDVDSLDFVPKLEKMMRQKSETLHLIGSKFASRANAPRLLLAVDQFEEVFTQCHDEDERRAFVENLLTAANKQGSVTILIGLRADFYDRCAHFEGLRELVSQQQEFIGPMNQQELVRVIAEPAKQGGWQFVEGLVEQIIEDAGQEPGRLPLLSHALRETWERRRGVAMTLAGYRTAGGVEGAIAKTAEEVLGRFDEGETAVAQSVFLSLTELGEGAEDTRRIASLTELEEANADKPLDDVLQMLINARLITTGDGQVEVAHEALIRRWPRLHGWLADNRERLRFERQLSQDANEWEELGRDDGSLYRGARLQQAVEWSERSEIQLNGRSGRFLGISRVHAERDAQEKVEAYKREIAKEKKIRQRTTMLFIVVSIVALTLLIDQFVLPEVLRVAAKSDENATLYPVSGIDVRFEIYEVTNERYFYCVDAGVCNTPNNWRAIRPDKVFSRWSDEWNENKLKPVVGIDANDAMTFCGWIGRSLPTASQWLHVVPAPDEWPNLKEDQALFCRSSVEDNSTLNTDSNSCELQSVGSQSIPQYFENKTTSLTGIYDLAGSVEEWTRTELIKIDGERERQCQDVYPNISHDSMMVALGDDFSDLIERVGQIDNANDSQELSNRSKDTLGFRCVDGSFVASNTQVCSSVENEGSE